MISVVGLLFKELISFALKLCLLVQVLDLHFWDYWLYVTSEHLIISSNTQRLHLERFTFRTLPAQTQHQQSQCVPDITFVNPHPVPKENWHMFCGINRSLYLTVRFFLCSYCSSCVISEVLFAGNDRCSYTDRSVPCTHCFSGELHLCVTHPVLSVYGS